MTLVIVRPSVAVCGGMLVEIWRLLNRGIRVTSIGVTRKSFVGVMLRAFGSAIYDSRAGISQGRTRMARWKMFDPREEMVSLWETLCKTWCSIMHQSAMWPIHGQYRCRTCGRLFNVSWAQNPSEVGRYAAEPRLRQINVVSLPIPANAGGSRIRSGRRAA